jgi:MtN3 and saliva related transmembrane protein
MQIGGATMELSQFLGWLGTVIGIFIGIPQLVKTIRTKKAGDLSVITFILILMTCSCLLVRAIAIKELAFIFYYIFLILINSLQIFLIWKYKER